MGKVKSGCTEVTGGFSDGLRVEFLSDTLSGLINETIVISSTVTIVRVTAINVVVDFGIRIYELKFLHDKAEGWQLLYYEVQCLAVISKVY